MVYLSLKAISGPWRLLLQPAITLRDFRTRTKESVLGNSTHQGDVPFVKLNLPFTGSSGRDVGGRSENARGTCADQ